MRWILTLILSVVFLFAACAPPGDVIVVMQPPPGTPPAEPPPAGLTGPVKAALYDGTTVRLWDGANTVDWKTGAAVGANGRKIAVGQVLYFLDASGAVTSSVNLPALPRGVIVIGDPVIYTFETLDRQWALDHGARYYPYTRVWMDGIEDPAWPWNLNEWTYASSFEAANGDVIAVDSQGHFWDIMRPELTNASSGFQNIACAIPGGPIFYVPDWAYPTIMTVYDAAHPSGFTPAWSGPSTALRMPWIEVNGVWYDGWGDKWDGSTFYARTTALKVFASASVPPAQWQADHGFQWPQYAEGPMPIPAYTDGGNIYFIETTTGTLWSYSPQTDVIAYVVAQLYDGDGKSATGEAKAKTLQPELVDGNLYYHDAGTLWRRDNASTVISSFSADQQMWVMR